MKKHCYLFFLLISLFGFVPLFGQLTLKGKIITDENRPVVNTRIAVSGGASAITNSKGEFEIVLSNYFASGEQVILAVDRPNWVINSPLDGVWNLPNTQYQNVHKVTIVIVPKGSKRLWTNARIEKFISQILRESTNSKAELQNLENRLKEKHQINFAHYFTKWAIKYGFLPDEVKIEFDKWASDTILETSKTLGLKYFYAQDFTKAAELLNSSAGRELASLTTLQNAVERKRDEVSETFLISGLAYYHEGSYRKSLFYLSIADSLANKKRSSETWAEILSYKGLVWISLGKYADPQNSINYLDSAINILDSVSNYYQAKNQMENWARTRNNLGNAYKQKGLRSKGEIAIKFLKSGIELYNQSLTIRKKDSFPLEWAETQNNLGILYSSLGNRVHGAKRVEYYEKAVICCENAIELISKEKDTYRWAITKSNLGNAYHRLGAMKNGIKGKDFFLKSIETYNNALEDLDRKEYPKEWARLQTNLGSTTSELALRVTGEERKRFLIQAIGFQDLALKEFSKKDDPQEWAITQMNKGACLSDLGEWGEENKKVQRLTESSEAYLSAVEIFSEDNSPQYWAAVQSNLGNTYQILGKATGGEKGIEYLKESIIAFQSALKVRKKELFPNLWASSQCNLGNAFLAMGELMDKEECINYYDRAIQAYEKALQVRTKEYSPHFWALTQNNLGYVYLSKGKAMEGKAAEKFIEDARAKFIDAQGVHTREGSPGYWTLFQENIAEADILLEEWELAIIDYQPLKNLSPIGYYLGMIHIHHNKIFDFKSSYTLSDSFIKLEKENTKGKVLFIQSNFTTGQFNEGERLLRKLKRDSSIISEYHSVLAAFRLILSIFFKENSTDIQNLFDNLIQSIQIEKHNKSINKWDYSGISVFLERSKEFGKYRKWLGKVFHSLTMPSNEEIVIDLKKLKNKIPNKNR